MRRSNGSQRRENGSAIAEELRAAGADAAVTEPG
jgi:hypothetical protein